MKNKDKYRERLLTIQFPTVFCHNVIEPLVLQSKGLKCRDKLYGLDFKDALEEGKKGYDDCISCKQCKLVTAMWLEEEYTDEK